MRIHITEQNNEQQVSKIFNLTLIPKISKCTPEKISCTFSYSGNIAEKQWEISQSNC